MILYKYTSLEAARKILDSSQIGFSRAGYFNDPFDTPVATSIPTDNPIHGFFADIGAQAKSSIWEEKTALLPLTRTATNALMWAHYSDNHRGAVLAINMSTAGFLDVETNFIPAHFGSVIYSRRRPGGPYSSTFKTGVTVGRTHKFVLDHYEQWQRIFLTKPLEWAYEEEVRVAKCLDGLQPDGGENESGTCTIINVGGRPLHCFDIPKNSITAVYFGARADEGEMAETVAKYDGIEYSRVRLDQNSFTIKLEPYEQTIMNAPPT